jgi:hypothetical protein
MSGQAHWIDGLVVLVGAVVVFGAFIWLAMGHHLKRVHRRLACPVRGEAFDVGLVQDRDNGFFIEVESCSAFPNPHQVRCHEECRRQLNLPWQRGSPPPS